MRVLVAASVVMMPLMPAQACRMTVSFLPSQVAASRIAAFTLKMRHGAVTQIATLFPAWQFSIDNEENFIVEASGHAIVGAAFLEPREITTLFSITPEPGYNCADLDRLHVMRLTLKLYRNDGMTDLTLGSHSIRIED